MKFDWHGVIARFSLLATILAGIGAGLKELSGEFGIPPKYALLVAVLSGSISAFTKRVQRFERRRKFPKNFLASLLLLSVALTFTACDTKSIATAKTQSRKMARYANAGVEVTREMYRAQIINLAQKDKIADGFIRLAAAGQLFEKAIGNLESAYGTQSVPVSEIDKLFKTFDEEVVNQFLDLLAGLKIVTVSEDLRQVISVLRSTIIAAAKFFGKKAVIQQRILTAEAK
jgi:hypothetical protein